jgi:HTH-type transcriptional regulator/antitoxin HigA
MPKMEIRPLNMERDYDWALAEIARYFDREPRRGTPQADRFDVLAALIEVYEA